MSRIDSLERRISALEQAKPIPDQRRRVFGGLAEEVSRARQANFHISQVYISGAVADLLGWEVASVFGIQCVCLPSQERDFLLQGWFEASDAA